MSDHVHETFTDGAAAIRDTAGALVDRTARAAGNARKQIDSVARAQLSSMRTMVAHQPMWSMGAAILAGIVVGGAIVMLMRRD